LTAPDTHLVLIEVPEEEITEAYLNVYARKEKEELVTSIEILSPSNKTPGNQGRAMYLRKQEEMMASGVNLVEIDLLRSGRHGTAVPLNEARAEVGDFDYHVCVHQAGYRTYFQVYPIRLRDPLPKIGVPLLAGDVPIAVELQPVFEKAYDTGPYDVRIPYAKMNPLPSLNADDTAWAAALLREKGIVPP
jgi:hypothetical protein